MSIAVAVRSDVLHAVSMRLRVVADQVAHHGAIPSEPGRAFRGSPGLDRTYDRFQRDVRSTSRALGAELDELARAIDVALAEFTELDNSLARSIEGFVT